MGPLVPLVRVDTGILSSYDSAGKTGGPRSGLVPLCRRASGVMVPGAARALAELNQVVLQRGGDLRITDCHRDATTQAAAHQAYLDGRKKAYVAGPGRSNHNAGRAVDIDIAMLAFPGVPRNQALDTLWALMAPLGWSAIIAQPIEGASESWHIEWHGELAGLYGRLWYADCALAGALLVGHAGKLGEGVTGKVRLIQALCHRLGVNVGPLDGALGPKTRAGAEKLLGAPLVDLDAAAVALWGKPPF